MPPWALLRVEWVQRKANFSLLNKGCCYSMHTNWRRLCLQKHVRACIDSEWEHPWWLVPPLPPPKVWDAEGTPLLSFYKHSGGRGECWRLITCTTPCFWVKGPINNLSQETQHFAFRQAGRGLLHPGLSLKKTKQNQTVNLMETNPSCHEGTKVRFDWIQLFQILIVLLYF